LISLSRRRLHETHGDALAAPLGKPTHPAQRGDGALAVGLHGEPEPAPVVERGIGKCCCKNLQRRVEAILLLGVDGDRQPA
jgi:hypothetical protein